jgi:hypothetical protein
VTDEIGVGSGHEERPCRVDVAAACGVHESRHACRVNIVDHGAELHQPRDQLREVVLRGEHERRPEHIARQHEKGSHCAARACSSPRLARKRH